MRHERIAILIEAAIRESREKYGDAPIGADGLDETFRLAILTEEVGEVAREAIGSDLYALRAELVQVAACATAWARVISCACGEVPLRAGERVSSFSRGSARVHTRAACGRGSRS